MEAFARTFWWESLLSADFIQKRDQPHDSDHCRDRLFSCATCATSPHITGQPCRSSTYGSTSVAFDSETCLESNSILFGCDTAAVQLQHLLINIFYMVIKGSFCWSWCRLISWLSNISCSSVCASRLLGLTLPCFAALHPCSDDI